MGKKKREKNTSFYGLVSKKVFRHLQWVMWKINSLESKAKFVWPQKGRERGSLQGNDKNLKILISICHGREQEKQAIGTSSWSFPLAGMLNSREKTNISVRFAFSEKIKSSPSCLVLCHWQPLVLFETPKKAELSVLVVCGKKEKSYGISGCSKIQPVHLWKAVFSLWGWRKTRVQWCSMFIRALLGVPASGSPLPSPNSESSAQTSWGHMIWFCILCDFRPLTVSGMLLLDQKPCLRWLTFPLTGKSMVCTCLQLARQEGRFDIWYDFSLFSTGPSKIRVSVASYLWEECNN